MPQETYKSMHEEFEIRFTHESTKIEGNSLTIHEVKTLLKEALTDDINNKQVYLQGIQQSYYYENLSEYNMNDI